MEPDFIEKDLIDMFREEVFVFWYYAGFGCSSGE